MTSSVKQWLQSKNFRIKFQNKKNKNNLIVNSFRNIPARSDFATEGGFVSCGRISFAMMGLLWLFADTLCPFSNALWLPSGNLLGISPKHFFPFFGENFFSRRDSKACCETINYSLSLSHRSHWTYNHKTEIGLQKIYY